MVKFSSICSSLLLISLLGCNKTSSQSVEEKIIFSRISPQNVEYSNLKIDSFNSKNDNSIAFLSNGKLGIRISKVGLLASSNQLCHLSNSFENSDEEKLISHQLNIPVEVVIDSKTLNEKLTLEPVKRISQRFLPNLQQLITTIEWVNGEVFNETVRLNSSRSLTVDVSLSNGPKLVDSKNWQYRRKPIVALGQTTTNGHKGEPNELVVGEASYKSLEVSPEIEGKTLFIDLDNPRTNKLKNQTPFDLGAYSSNIEIEGDPGAQNLLNFYSDILASSIPVNDKSTESPSPTGPFGLTNPAYFGHQFWDADVWMLPALKLTQPNLALQISNYRISKLAAAKQNYIDWVNSGRPIGRGELPQAKKGAIAGAIKFPWESGTSGKETVPGPSRYQDHISGSVLFGMEQLADLGLIDQVQLNEIGQGVAKFYLDRIEIKPNSTFDMNGTMSPDEHHIANNDLYTNILVERIFQKYAPAPFNKLKANRARKGTKLLTYENDREKGYKQAAAILSIWPLEDNEAVAQAADMMTRFPDKVTKNGPAMSASIDATIFARLGEPDKALEILEKEIKDYANRPFFLMSEKKSQNRTVFLTGIAGYLNAFYYGFCGISIVDSSSSLKSKMISPSINLGNGKSIIFNPHLPKDWNGVKLKLVVQNKNYLITIGKQNKVTLQTISN